MKFESALLVIGTVVGAIACSAAPPEAEVTARSIQALDVPPEAVACTHGICASGEALVATCDPCATALCAQDPYCCNTVWDATCVGEVPALCGKTCAATPGGGGGGGAACAHSTCTTGGPLSAACDPCATALCASDPYCCSGTWDATCVGEVATFCGKSCTPGVP